MRGFYISVKNDLLEPKHFEQMGNSVWLYLWLLDKITSISESGEGKVLGGKPIKYNDLGMGFSQRTYGRQIKQLQKYEYIKAIRTPYGYVFTIYKAKKYFGNNEIRQKGKSIEIRQVGGNKEDNTAIDNTIILSGRGPQENYSSKAKKDMGNWNVPNDNDDDLPALDDETGEYRNPKKVDRRKYPNAPEVRKVFLKVLGKNDPSWSSHTGQLQASERLSTDRGLEQIERALLFFVEHKDNEFCPKIRSPFELEAKWSQLSDFKKKIYG